MNAKAMMPLVLAVVLGLTAALLVRSMMSHRTAAPTGPSNLVTVVVAKLESDPGHALTPDDVGTARVPAETAPGQVFSDPAQLVGRVTISPLVKGETVLDNLLAPTGTGAGLQALIPAGMRAVTLEVSEFSGVGGMLEPGSKVDVVSVIHDEHAKGGGSVARTVLQNIKVTAVGRSIAPAHPAPGQPLPPASNSVTLLCTPKQAQQLQLATNAGRPWLILRSTRDGADVPVEATTMAELTGAPADVPDALAKAEPKTEPKAEPQPDAKADATPATPVVAVDPPPATVRRSVTMINGGVESQVTVTIPNPQATIVTPDTGFVDPDGK